VPVEKIIIKEVPIEVIKEVIVEKIIEVCLLVPLHKWSTKRGSGPCWCCWCTGLTWCLQVPVDRIVERIVEVEKPVTVEKIVEIPVERIVIKEVEKIVEVPVERVVLKEVPVYVDRWSLYFLMIDWSVNVLLSSIAFHEGDAAN
jgi:hypothetical protein